MTYYHCPEEKKNPAVYTEVRAAEVNHGKREEDCGLRPCLRMENHANTLREMQKPQIHEPGGQHSFKDKR